MNNEIAGCEGGCACGEVRYKVTSGPMIVHACHCRLCQRQTGSTNVINAVYEADRVVVLQGDVEEVTLATPSGEGQLVSRCPSCKTAIWSNYLINGQGRAVRFLRGGTLDNPDLLPPDVHIFTVAKVPWYVIPEGQLAVKYFYDAATTWSADCKHRIVALEAKTGKPYR